MISLKFSHCTKFLTPSSKSKFKPVTYFAIKLFNLFIVSHITLSDVVHTLILAFICTIPPKHSQVYRQLARVFIQIASLRTFPHT